MKDYQIEQAKTIYNVLHYRSNAILTRGNWGANGFTICMYKDMPTLRFNVKGGKLKGLVNVCYNEGADTFEVATMKIQRKKNAYGFFDKTLVELEHVKDVYIDELMRVIDSRVCDI